MLLAQAAPAMVPAASMSPPIGPHELDQASAWARDRLAAWIPVASISATGSRLAEGAAFTRGLLEESGLEATVLGGAGAPVVLGERPAPPGAPTVLVYGHYDVQPADPLEAWSSPPFEASLRGGAIYGRGAGDNKGQLLAHLAAIRSLARGGSLPVGIKVLVEGEEEVGSPHVGDVVAGNAGRLAADVAITSDAPLHGDGRGVVIFGVRGLLYLEIEVEGARADVHSGNRGGLAPAPAWDLVLALAGLRGADGSLLAELDAQVRAPTPAEERLLRELPVDLPALHAELGVEHLAPGADADPWRRLMFEPSLNICGLHSGYRGPGAKTIVPHRASCKLDVRLVADQDPERVEAVLRRHFAEHAPRARVRRLAAVPPSATDPTHPLARAVCRAVAAADGRPPLLRPRLGGTTPDWIFTRLLAIPSVLVPYGPPDMNHHAPDERMSLAALARGIRCSAAIYREIAAATQR